MNVFEIILYGFVGGSATYFVVFAFLGPRSAKRIKEIEDRVLNAEMKMLMMENDLLRDPDYRNAAAQFESAARQMDSMKGDDDDDDNYV